MPLRTVTISIGVAKDMVTAVSDVKVRVLLDSQVSRVASTVVKDLPVPRILLFLGVWYFLVPTFLTATRGVSGDKELLAEDRVSTVRVPSVQDCSQLGWFGCLEDLKDLNPTTGIDFRKVVLTLIV